MALINEVSNSIIYVIYVLREFSCCSVNEFFNINGEKKQSNPADIISGFISLLMDLMT